MTIIWQAFWDSLVDDIKLSPPCYVRVIRVLSEIRDGIIDVSGKRESVITAVGEAIDIDFIKLQVDHEAYGWEDCKHLIGAVVGIIKSIQAPKRDVEMQKRWIVVGKGMLDSDMDQPRVLCNALEFLLDCINLLRIDSANAR